MTALTFYDVENAAPATALDLGTVAPSSSDDTMLRLSNPDQLFQAEDVIVTATGTDAIQLWLSLDGDVFAESINVGDIAPGGISTTFWLRRITPGDAAPSASASLTATPTSWTNYGDNGTTTNVYLDTAG